MQKSSLNSYTFITNPPEWGDYRGAEKGMTSQHIDYTPFGEVLLEEMTGGWYAPYKFNAKELDMESGLYYYGARYYDPQKVVFYGVDPKADKYPDISPFTYCHNNPIRLIDPNGMEDIDPPSASTKPVPVPENTKIGGGKLIPGVEVIDNGPSHKWTLSSNNSNERQSSQNQKAANNNSSANPVPAKSGQQTQLPTLSNTDKGMVNGGGVVVNIVQGAAYKEVEQIMRYAGKAGKLFGAVSFANRFSEINNKGWDKATWQDYTKLGIDAGMILLKANPYTISFSIGYGIVDGLGYNPIDLIKK